MGISCQINLCKPPDGVFYNGDIVSGSIIYSIDQPIEIEKITTSLKGIGKVTISDYRSKNSPSYSEREVYVDTDNIVKEGTSTVPAGSYELKLSFKLPEVLPPSYKFKKFVSHYHVDSSIKYYIRIKFDVPGWFSFAKRFRKVIDVVSSTTPNLLMKPVIYGMHKKLSQLFTKGGTVAIKANITNSVISIGEKIEVQYEILNNTNITVKSIETKLMEVNTFNVRGVEEVKAFEDIPDTDSKTGRILPGVTQSLPVEIIVPAVKVSFDESKFMSRGYVVRITATLPMPHRNVKFDIPVQIRETIQRQEVCDAPPSYWEVMGEEKKEKESDD